MRLGVVIPQTESGADPGAVRDYAQAAGSLGYQHLVVMEHVPGGRSRQVMQGWTGRTPIPTCSTSPSSCWDTWPALPRVSS